MIDDYDDIPDEVDEELNPFSTSLPYRDDFDEIPLEEFKEELERIKEALSETDDKSLIKFINPKAYKEVSRIMKEKFGDIDKKEFDKLVITSVRDMFMHRSVEDFKNELTVMHNMFKLKENSKDGESFDSDDFSFNNDYNKYIYSLYAPRTNTTPYFGKALGYECPSEENFDPLKPTIDIAITEFTSDGDILFKLKCDGANYTNLNILSEISEELPKLFNKYSIAINEEDKEFVILKKSEDKTKPDFISALSKYANIRCNFGEESLNGLMVDSSNYINSLHEMSSDEYAEIDEKAIKKAKKSKTPYKDYNKMIAEAYNFSLEYMYINDLDFINSLSKVLDKSFISNDLVENQLLFNENKDIRVMLLETLKANLDNVIYVGDYDIIDSFKSTFVSSGKNRYFMSDALKSFSEEEYDIDADTLRKIKYFRVLEKTDKYILCETEKIEDILPVIFGLVIDNNSGKWKLYFPFYGNPSFQFSLSEKNAKESLGNKYLDYYINNKYTDFVVKHAELELDMNTVYDLPDTEYPLESLGVITESELVKFTLKDKKFLIPIGYLSLVNETNKNDLYYNNCKEFISANNIKGNLLPLTVRIDEDKKYTIKKLNMFKKFICSLGNLNDCRFISQASAKYDKESNSVYIDINADKIIDCLDYITK